MAEFDFVRLEEHLNQLLYDPEIQKLRRALPDYVAGKLLRRGLARLEELGLDAAAREEFLSAVPAADTRLFQIVQENQTALGLSGRMFLEFRMLSRADRKSGLDFLEEALASREQIRFRKEAGIPAKAWLNFLNCRNYTGEATLEKIRRGLALTPEELPEFERRVIRQVFPVGEVLRAEVHRLQAATGMNVSSFLIYAWISTDAWEAFYPVRGESQARRTSQETLLKLVIGYSLKESAARTFMETAGSAFVVRRDLVVLAGIRCGFCRPMEMQKILDHFSAGRDGQPCYVNLYPL